MKDNLTLALTTLAILLTLGGLFLRGSDPAVSEARPPEASAAPAVREVTVEPSSAPACGQERVDAVLAEFTFQLPNGWDVVTECGQSPFSGLSDTGEKSITVWPDVSDDAGLRDTLIHESAHVLDYEHMLARERDLWKYARGTEGQPWWRDENPDPDRDNWDTPSEDFAEVFTQCLTGNDYEVLDSMPGERPTRADCALALSLLRDVPGMGGVKTLAGP